eukprot:786443_1
MDNYRIWKAFNMECMNGTLFTNDMIALFYRQMLINSKKYHVVDSGGDNAEELKEVSVGEKLISNWKKEWNVTKYKSGAKTAYDIDVIMPQHAVVLCKVYTLRRLFPTQIQYIGHHDQVCLFYGGDSRYIYTTHFASSVSGKPKIQNNNKTFTAVPTVYDYFQENDERNIQFGPTIAIFESATKDKSFSDHYKRQLRAQ